MKRVEHFILMIFTLFEDYLHKVIAPKGGLQICTIANNSHVGRTLRDSVTFINELSGHVNSEYFRLAWFLMMSA